MLRVTGSDITDGSGKKVVLRGVAFGNEVYSGVRVPLNHHAEADYENLGVLGMNSVRFYLNYLTFEEDAKPGVYKQEGWDWLDRNIAWAKKHKIFLVLNMHVPPGGYQSLGKGVGLWNDQDMQNRFVALWQAIAGRYAGEVTIAGFDLLNEPVVTRSKEQWQELANRTIAAIRAVNAHHMIFVERVNAVRGDWSEDSDRNFFRVDDRNVVYEFHFYKPFHFTHQGAPWTDFSAEEGKYPNPQIAEVEWFRLRKQGEAESPSLPEGDSDWREVSTAPIAVTDPSWVIGKPLLICDKNGGQAFFDDLRLERWSGEGKLEETLWRENLASRRGWYFWSEERSGRSLAVAEGHGDGTSLSIEGTTAGANLGSDVLRFVPQTGKTYRLRGFLKGKNITPASRCGLRLEFSSSQVPVRVRDKSYLEAELDSYLEWGRREQVPLYLGEFGTIRKSFEAERGGAAWVSDMLDLLQERNLSFAYHAYHEEFFALYYGAGLPRADQANLPLIDLLREKLNKQPPERDAAAGEPMRPAVE